MSRCLGCLRAKAETGRIQRSVSRPTLACRAISSSSELLVLVYVNAALNSFYMTTWAIVILITTDDLLRSY